jgi:toluene monooxygenase system protein A
MPEYLDSIGEARMGRLGRAAAWRNMALYGTLDEIRHGQIQFSFPQELLKKEPRFDWAHKSHHTNECGVIAIRHFFDDVFTSNDAVSTAIQLTFTVQTGFTNLQFLGMAADPMETGDVAFGALISSIQTDEARHAQQGEPTLRMLIKHGNKAEAQRLIDVAFLRS